MKSNVKSFVAGVGLGILGLAAAFYSGPRAPIGAATGQTVSGGTVSILPMPGTGSTPAIAQVNMEPVLGLVEHLQGYGAKVSMSEFEKDGLTFVVLSVNGKALPPIVSGATKAGEVIVFEY